VVEKKDTVVSTDLVVTTEFTLTQHWRPTIFFTMHSTRRELCFLEST
jgi:hypothetical protein